MTEFDNQPGEFRRSFLNDPKLEEAQKPFQIYREQSLIDQFSGQSNLLSQAASALRHHPPISPIRHAFFVSTLEMSALLVAYPTIINEVPQLPSLYRLVRGLELGGEFTRGGNTLFVGAGIVTHEFLALYLDPPSDSVLDTSLQRLQFQSLQSIIDETYSQPLYYAPVPSFRDGTAYAIEPDPMCLVTLEKTYPRFLIPKGRILVSPSPLQDLIDTPRLPQNLDNIIWHRADPEAFPDYLTPTVGALLKCLRPGGRLFVSIGEGNSEQELQARKQFLQELFIVLPQVGARLSESIPLFFDGDIAELLFGVLGVGIKGALVAQKVSS